MRAFGRCEKQEAGKIEDVKAKKLNPRLCREMTRRKSNNEMLSQLNEEHC